MLLQLDFLFHTEAFQFVFISLPTAYPEGK